MQAGLHRPLFLHVNELHIIEKYFNYIIVYGGGEGLIVIDTMFICILILTNKIK
mgnify:CR=1 FL=1